MLRRDGEREGAGMGRRDVASSIDQQRYRLTPRTPALHEQNRNCARDPRPTAPPAPRRAFGEALSRRWWGESRQYWTALPSWRRRRRERRVIARTDNSLFDTCVCIGIKEERRAKEATICTGEKKEKVRRRATEVNCAHLRSRPFSSSQIRREESRSHGRVNGTVNRNACRHRRLLPYHADLAPQSS
ncbi:hypothetical protein MTO96_007648 [Rhipicephalus appendiculatus]